MDVNNEYEDGPSAHLNDVDPSETMIIRDILADLMMNNEQEKDGKELKTRKRTMKDYFEVNDKDQNKSGNEY